MPPASSSARPTRGQLRIRRPPGTESRGIPVAPSAPSRGRPLVLVACVAVVGVVVAVAAWFVVSGRQSPTPATTTVRVSPTPTLTPVQRPTTNAFVDRLPSTTLQYALVSSEPEPAWVDAGAIEAYVEQFSDGGSGTFTLRAGQWSTAEAADAAFLAFTAGAERP
ncbi:MAG: hypothetical protein FWE61_11755, partial [Micrococcales bacterium]|nr:hypothetical protein [Micrococcales bacterium]